MKKYLAMINLKIPNKKKVIYSSLIFLFIMGLSIYYQKSTATDWIQTHIFFYCFVFYFLIYYILNSKKDYLFISLGIKKNRLINIKYFIILILFLLINIIEIILLKFINWYSFNLSHYLKGFFPAFIFIISISPIFLIMEILLKDKNWGYLLRMIIFMSFLFILIDFFNLIFLNLNLILPAAMLIFSILYVYSKNIYLKKYYN